MIEAQAPSSLDLQTEPPFPFSLPMGPPPSSPAPGSPSSEASAADIFAGERLDSPESAAPDRDACVISVMPSSAPAAAASVNGQEPSRAAEEVSFEAHAPEGASTAAVKLQKVYRSYRTRRRLADSAVVAEELWWQAIDYARLNQSTISFFNFSKPESAASKWSRVSLNAAKVGKGLSKDAKAQKLAFQHWIEAIDPRHRYGHSLHIYYEEWCKADAGQPFFYCFCRLDIGDGKELDLEECPRSKLRQQCIKYLGPQERENFEYLIVEGKIIHKQSGEFLQTRKQSEGAKWIFVMSTLKRLYAGEKKKGVFHHSSFLAGGATLAAGRLVVEHGVLKSISAYSGHYRPNDNSLNSFLSFLKENGVNLKEVEIHKATEDSDMYEEDKSIAVVRSSYEVSGISENSTPEIPEEERECISVKSLETPTLEGKDYKRTLSGGLRSPRAEVPEKAILQRINSKKTVNSYQLGHQLFLKWSTGAGPRIGCVADYPVELRQQALEFVNLSPRHLPSPSVYRQFPAFSSPRSSSPADISNGCECSP